jgi:hypothetical protein
MACHASTEKGRDRIAPFFIEASRETRQGLFLATKCTGRKGKDFQQRITRITRMVGASGANLKINKLRVGRDGRLSFSPSDFSQKNL